MNTRILPVSAFWVAVGAGAVLIIGAFGRFDPVSSPRAAADPAAAPNEAPLTQDDPPAEATGAPALPANLSPGLAEIIKLAQAHVDESVILAYVKNSGHVFSPTADEILYLADLGLPQDVIGAMIKTSAPAAPPASSEAIAATATSLPPPNEPSPATGIPPEAASEASPEATAFYTDLAPYGAWTQQPDYGLCWQPTIQTIDPNWTPYLDGGQWLYSDSGWYWHSDYTWGWAAFHYGRWTNIPRRGWVWVPGNQWGPAWVAWRSTESYIGWAPLPPGVSLNFLGQLNYHSKPIGPHATFGLSPSAFTFVTPGNLTARNLPRRVLPAARAQDLVRSSALLDSYAIVNDRIFNGGISREAVAAAARKPVPEIALRSVSSPEAAGLARDRKTLAVYLPPVSSAGASSSAPSVKNEDRAQTERSKVSVSPEEPVMLAENKLAAEEILPADANSGGVYAPLPSLHYPTPASSPVVRRHTPGIIIASGVDATPPNRDWPPGYARTAGERPLTSFPAPRFEGLNPPVIRAEPPRIAVENRPGATEVRAAPVEPVHSAPAPTVSSSSGNSKSGK